MNKQTEIAFIHFQKPTGKRTHLVMTLINPEAAQYINENNIHVSTENGIDDDIVVYFDDGKMLDDDVTPDEIIVIAGGRDCAECMDEGVELLKKRAG